MSDPWENLLEIAKSVHLGSRRLQDFCPFPKDIKKQILQPFHIPASDLMQNENGLCTDDNKELRDAFIAASPYAHWRQTYKGTTVGNRFLDEFGCYGLIGPESPFQSEKIRAWVVYMPRNFYYPWHQHPAEEMYFCIAGEAVFRRENFPDTCLKSGGTMEHSTNQPHSMETLNHPVMAYVVWRNEFGTKPILTYEDAR
jgi:quercetin dioxygenase-like cupin family protein